MAKVESKIQREIIEYLNSLPEAYVYNAVGNAVSAKGTSDLLVCYKGLFLALEVKRPDGSYALQTDQAIRQRQVRKAHGIAEVVTSIKDVATLLRSLGV
jgi:hypothetical protein